MRRFCIVCDELPARLEDAAKHFQAREVEVDFVSAIHGETFGLLPSRPYNVDRPGCGFLNPISQVGLVLSHFMLWQICYHGPGDVFMILEDDAKFPVDWEERLDLAMVEDLPADWDIFLIGSSNTEDKPKKHICGDVWDVKYPFTTHAYLVRKKALCVLIANCRDATTKIDLLMIQKAYPLLNVYTMLPRLVDQRGTELMP